MIQAKASTKCEVKIISGRCPNEAVALVFDEILCCEAHRQYIYDAWAERSSGKIILH